MNIFQRRRAYQRTSVPPLEGFVTEWRTTQVGEVIYLPLRSDGVYDFDVNWGDGSEVENISVYTNNTHTYSTAGTHTVTITGTIEGWSFGAVSNSKNNITKINNWGPLVITSDRSFASCFYLTHITATDTFTYDTTAIGSTSMYQMFYFNFNLESITSLCDDTSLITNFRGMFNVTKLTEAPAIDFTSATDVRRMFSSCNLLTTAQNIDLSPLNNINAGNMFDNCPNLTDVTGLKIDGVNDAYAMFDDCYSLVTVPNLVATSLTDSDYMFSDCSALTTLTMTDTDLLFKINNMFANCTSLTHNPVEDISGASNASNMYAGVTLSTTEYDDYLDYLANTMTPKPTGLSINFGNSKYSSGTPTTNRTVLTSLPYSWTIVDGGQV
jgi:hypothetical protein